MFVDIILHRLQIGVEILAAEQQAPAIAARREPAERHEVSEQIKRLVIESGDHRRHDL